MTTKPTDDFREGEEGVFLSLPAATYHKAPGFSNSLGKHLSPPSRLPHYLACGIETTVEMILGTLCHQAVLEPGVPFPQIAVKPEKYPGKDKQGLPMLKDWTRNAHYCEAWEDAQEAAGKIVLSQKEMDQVNGMVGALTNNDDDAPGGMREVIRRIFEDCDTEVSLFRDAWVQIGADADGKPIMRKLLRKGRLDIVPRKFNFLADIKSVPKGGADAHEFQQKLFDMDYYVQAASNLSIARDSGIVGKVKFLFVVIERDPPYCVALHVLEADSNALRLGALEWERRMTTYARCADEKRWPGYPSGFNPIDLAQYAVKELELR